MSQANQGTREVSCRHCWWWSQWRSGQSIELRSSWHFPDSWADIRPSNGLELHIVGMWMTWYVLAESSLVDCREIFPYQRAFHHIPYPCQCRVLQERTPDFGTFPPGDDEPVDMLKRLWPTHYPPARSPELQLQNLQSTVHLDLLLESGPQEIPPQWHHPVELGQSLTQLRLHDLWLWSVRRVVPS